MKKIHFLFIAIFFLLPIESYSIDFGTLLFGDSKPKQNYMGQLADNRKDRNGTGILLLKNSNVYIGNFSRGKQSGYGMMIVGDKGKLNNIPGAAVYIGEWYDNKKEGKGSCYAANGDLIYKGTFMDDCPTDPYPTPSPDSHIYFTDIETPSGEYFIGEVDSSIPNGFGISILLNGAMAIGHYQNGNRKGIGLLLSGPNDWMSVKWVDSNTYSTISSSQQYEQRLAEYKEASAKFNAELRKQFSEVFMGLSGVANDYVAYKSSKSSTNHEQSFDDNNTPSTKKRKTNTQKNNDCGSAWMSASRSYSDYESQLVPNGARSATNEAERNAIKSKMRSIRQKWEQRGCPITKSPYED